MRIDVRGHCAGPGGWRELVGWVERSETHQAIASTEKHDKTMGFAALNPSYTLHFRWMNLPHRHGADQTLDVIAPRELGPMRQQRRRTSRDRMAERILQIAARGKPRHHGAQKTVTGA